jgi:hypothetical protein
MRTLVFTVALVLGEQDRMAHHRSAARQAAAVDAQTLDGQASASTGDIDGDT